MSREGDYNYSTIGDHALQATNQHEYLAGHQYDHIVNHGLAHFGDNIYAGAGAAIHQLQHHVARLWIRALLVLVFGLLLQLGIFSALKTHERTQDNRRQSEQQRQEVATWLTRLTFDEKQIQTFETRSAGTGKWLLQSDEFRNWLTGDEPALWLSGARKLLSAIRIPTSDRYSFILSWRWQDRSHVSTGDSVNPTQLAL